MAHINRRYIDSHYLLFAAKGILAVLFGLFLIFNGSKNITALISTIGCFLAALGISEAVSAAYRRKKRQGALITLIIAILDAAVALALLLTLGQNTIYHLIIIAVFTFIHGICEILIGFFTTVDPTDRFIWVLSGILGAVMGIVLLNIAGFVPFFGIYRPSVSFFGIYLLSFGLCSLIYAAHNRAQKIEDRVARSEVARTKHAKSSPKRK